MASSRLNGQSRVSEALRLALVPLFMMLGGCRGEISDSAPVLLIRHLWSQPKYHAQSETSFFADHRTMRSPVEGTVSREHFIENEAIETGRLDDDSGYVLTVPREVIEHFGGAGPTLERGEERFNIYCGVCHGRNGAGNGVIVQRGLTRPPVFTEPRLRHMPDGQVYATITHGVRNMPAYNGQIPVYDRWAVVTYFRALQLSQIAATEPKK